MDVINFKMIPPREFWDLMTNPAFIRTGPRNGRMRGAEYETPFPPEDIPSFIDAKIAEVNNAL